MASVNSNLLPRGEKGRGSNILYNRSRGIFGGAIIYD